MGFPETSVDSCENQMLDPRGFWSGLAEILKDSLPTFPHFNSGVNEVAQTCTSGSEASHNLKQ